MSTSENNRSKAAGRGRSALLSIGLIALGALAGYATGRFFSAPKGPGDGHYKVVVASTTDLHGSFFEDGYRDGEKRSSSLARVTSFVDRMRASGIDPVLIDVGDVIQGDLAAYYYNFIDTASTHIFAEMSRFIGYDAFVVGNHDIEPGHAVYDRYRRDLSAPLLAANAIATDGRKAGKPYFDEYTIVRRGKIKVAVIGFTNANIGNWLRPALWSGMEFRQVSEVAQEVIDRVKAKEKPHLTVVAVHSGRGDGEAALENEALFLARSLKGVDLILYGHDHRPLADMPYNPSGPIALLNAGSHARAVAVAAVDFDIKNGVVCNVGIEADIVPMDDESPSVRFEERFKGAYSTVDNYADRPVCTLTEDIDFEGGNEAPSAYLTLIHDVQMAVTGAEISFTAPLTTRGSLPAGPLSQTDMATLYRFENLLVTIDLTGQQIRDYLEFSYNGQITGEAPSYNHDSAAGIIYRVDASAPFGSRVEILSMEDGTPFDADKTYKVALNSYRANGGGYHLRDGAGVDPSELEIGPDYGDVRSLIREFLAAKGEFAPRLSKNWELTR